MAMITAWPRGKALGTVRPRGQVIEVINTLIIKNKPAHLFMLKQNDCVIDKITLQR